MVQVHNAPLPVAPRRQRSRLSTRLPARVTTLGGQADCVLLDLSLTGARIGLPASSHLIAETKCGSGAEVEWDGHSAFGFIAWIANRTDSFEFGIHFDQIITPQALIATRDIHDEFWDNGGFSSLQRDTARRWVKGIGG